ncbi:MAG TPA: hypothetical protein VHO07_10530 [Streptosporangiaceae bacterium]|nr:hypothetical protein [Streptosporangiaceae bacterium]
MAADAWGYEGEPQAEQQRSQPAGEQCRRYQARPLGAPAGKLADQQSAETEYSDRAQQRESRH